MEKEQARLALLDAKFNLEWGAPFWLWWAVHDTKGGGFGIVNQLTGEKTHLHRELATYYQWAREYHAGHLKKHGGPPQSDEFRAQAVEQLKKQIKAIGSGP